MRWNEAARVGLAVLLALGMLVFATFFLRGSFGRAKTYTQRVSFPNAQGIQEGAYVRVRGVDMGEVEDISLGAENAAVLTLRINEEYRVKPEDSIRIVGGLFGFSPPYVEITPGGRAGAATTANGDVLQGETGPNTDQLVSEAEQLIRNVNGLAGQMTELTGNLNRIVGDPALRNNLARTAANFEKVSESGVDIARNMERATARADRLVVGFQRTANNLDQTLRRADALLTSFRSTAEETKGLMSDARSLVQDTRGVVQGSGEFLKSSNALVQNAGELVTDTRAIVGENRERLKEVLVSLDTSLKQLDKTLAEAQSFLSDQNIRSDFRATAANIRDATDNLKKITEDVRGLSSDPQVQEDLRVTLFNLREASEEAGDVFRRVKGVLGTGGRTAKSIGERVAEADLRAGLTRTFITDRTRLDFDATIPWSDSTYYRLGFYDFGESNKFNVQAGHRMPRSTWLRYGIYASKLGFGFDVGDRQRPAFALDLFGIDRPQVDLRGNLPIAPHLDLTLGLDNVFRRADPIFGVRYRK